MHNYYKTSSVFFHKKITFFLFLAILLFQPFYGQTFKVSGIKKDVTEEMISGAGSDTARVRLSYLLMKKKLGTNVDSATLIARKSLVYALRSGHKPSIAKSYDGLGLCFEYKFEFDSAVAIYSKALSIRIEIKDIIETAADYGNIGTVYLESGNYPKALDYLLKTLHAIEISEQEYPGNLRLQTIKANTLGNLGVLYLSTDKLDKALECDYKAQEIYRNKGDLGNELSTLNTIANIYYTQHNFGKALEIQNEALLQNKILKDPNLEADLYCNMGNTFKAMGLLDKAISTYLEAANRSENLNDSRKVGIIYHNLGESYFKKGDQDKSLLFTNKSLTLSLSSKYPDLVRDNYELLYNIYNQKHDSEKALGYFRNYIEIRDKLFNEENTRKTVQAEMTYEFDKREAVQKAEQNRKDELNSEKQKKERLIRNALITGFALVLLLAIVILRGYRQKQKANLLLADQKHEIEEQKKQIDDSINYARYIQRAILPVEEDIVSSFKDIFGFYKPKDVVSGDFYWFAKHDDKTLIAVADCTGHGVPGAFMSMIGSDKLNQIIEKGVTRPSEILSQLNRSIKAALKQNLSGSTSRDGMDIALCSFDLANRKLEYAGANRPLFLIRNNGLREYEPVKSAIGGLTDDSRSYENNEIDLLDGDRVYIFTDGFVDQFGGEKNKKFMTRRFRQLLLEIHQKPMKEQESILEDTLHNWKGTHEQVDDVLVIGIAI